MYARIRLLRAILREHACVCVWVIEAEGRGEERMQERARERERGDVEKAERRANINSSKNRYKKKINKCQHPDDSQGNCKNSQSLHPPFLLLFSNPLSITGCTLEG